MTTFTSSTVHTTTNNRSIWRHGAVAALAASAATSAVAAIAHAAGVSLDVNGEPIPVAGFATMTLLFTAIGFVIAVALRRWASSPRRTFVRTTVALTALSFLPDLFVSGAAAETRVTLMATHLVAAAIFIPTIASRLPKARS
ncbi:MAG: hypothetical protein JWR83_3198 [Aeromicrobium sp.]|nr:hypothetical protein [Aeromicrobium sp.]